MLANAQCGRCCVSPTKSTSTHHERGAPSAPAHRRRRSPCRQRVRCSRCAETARAGALGVARERRLDDLLVLGTQAARAGSGAAARCGGDSAATGRRASSVKRSSQRDGQPEISAMWKCRFARSQPMITSGVASIIEVSTRSRLWRGGDDAPLPFERAEFDRLPQRLDLDDLARRGDVVELLAADRRDPIAALRLALDQAVGDEPRQRLAQRACAEAVGLAQVLDPQLLRRRQRAADDVVAQPPIGALDLAARRRSRASAQSPERELWS